MLHIPIEEGSAYVYRDTFQVLKCHQCKDCPQSCPLGCRAEGLVKVQPRPLGEALANQPAFVSLYGAIWPALEFEHPSAANGSSAIRDTLQSKCAILKKAHYLFMSSLQPLVCIRPSLDVSPILGLWTELSAA